ncbi:putative F-box/LRR-repeat protein 9 [Arachis hypogaea]|nr:putative F-box/LRR-repeat protein 9 [Arachis hypogaea]QHO36627.1 F-box protein [Arachis hypogaea]
MHLRCPSYSMEAEFQRRLFAPESPSSFIWYTNPLLRRPHQERQEQKSSRNWLHLPVELILIIFEKLGAIEVLTSVQRVCMLWRTICKDPYTWRVINMRVVGFPKFMDYQLSSLCRRTIERSCGLLVDISIDYFATKYLLNHIANSCGSRLRRLRLYKCDYARISKRVLRDSAKKFPLLEELEITNCHCILPIYLESLGQACPLLKTFKFSHHRQYCYDHISSCHLLAGNEYAYAIARSMPQLRHLQLVESNLDYDGLHAILNGCPHLKSLDLRHCINLDLKRKIIIEMLQGRIKDFRLPILGASTIDYEFCSLLPCEEAMKNWNFNILVEKWQRFQDEKIAKLDLVVKYEDEEVWEDVDMTWVTMKNRRRQRRESTKKFKTLQRSRRKKERLPYPKGRNTEKRQVRLTSEACVLERNYNYYSED